MARLYRVEVTVSGYVVADSPSHAARMIGDDIDDGTGWDVSSPLAALATAAEVKSDGWLGVIPFSQVEPRQEERTCAEILKGNP